MSFDVAAGLFTAPARQGLTAYEYRSSSVDGNFAQFFPLCNKEVTLDCDYSKIVSPDVEMSRSAMAYAAGYSPPEAAASGGGF